MKDKNNFYHINKKTIYVVLAIHFIFIFLLIFQVNFFKNKKKQNLIVNNILQPKIPTEKVITKDLLSAKQKIINKPIPSKKVNKPQVKKEEKQIVKDSNKAPVLEKKTNKSLEKATVDLITKLEKEINQIDNPPIEIVKSDLLIPKIIDTKNSNQESSTSENIKSLNIDSKIQNEQSPLSIKELLVKELQENLNLPEYGQVKVSFWIQPNGEIKNVIILEHQSEKNQKYLKNSLSELSFKSINKMFDEPQQFIVIFKND